MTATCDDTISLQLLNQNNIEGVAEVVVEGTAGEQVEQGCGNPTFDLGHSQLPCCYVLIIPIAINDLCDVL